MKLTILGAGLSGITLAHFLQDHPKISSITLLEKEAEPGGLCRSFSYKGITYDIGPHIIFSKNAETLDFMTDLLEDNKAKLRRSNRILHAGRRIQYPFENDLSKLPARDLHYCVNSFVNNPYETYAPQNMLQFFLSTFGEGITNLYLRPYNEKIWKFDPAFMDTQMVDRIPKPPVEDILASAKGDTIDGYTHQLYFSYPKENGIAAIIEGLVKRLNSKVKILCNKEVNKVIRTKNGYEINCGADSFNSDFLISTMPLDILTKNYSNCTEKAEKTAANLKYNSLYLALVNVKKQEAGDNFAFLVADKNIIFHRFSKVDFLGGAYSHPDSETYLIEITYRKDDIYDKMDKSELLSSITKGLCDIGFIDSEADINFSCLERFEYTYVIYDLMHRSNVNELKEFFENEGIYICGRFGSYEYLNMDQVIDQARDLSDRLKKEWS